MPITPRAQTLKIAELVDYQGGSVVSRIVMPLEMRRQVLKPSFGPDGQRLAGTTPRVGMRQYKT